jgi:hypothetical protein
MAEELVKYIKVREGMELWGGMGYMGKEKGREVWGGEGEKENKRTQMARPPKGSQSESAKNNTLR